MFKILLLVPSHKLQSISTSLQFSKIFTGSLSLNGLIIKSLLIIFQSYHEWPAFLLASKIIAYYTLTSTTVTIPALSDSSQRKPLIYIAASMLYNFVLNTVHFFVLLVFLLFLIASITPRQLVMTKCYQNR